jgi:hypothetical protein
MKQPPKSEKLQLNLPLLSVPATVIPDHQKDLTLALVELLLSAADEDIEPQGNGGGDESEAHY